MHKHYLSFFLIFIFFNAHAQNNNSDAVSWSIGNGGTGGEKGKSIVADNAGNTFTTGYFEGTVDFDPGPGVANLTSSGYFDVYITKCNPLGEFLWAKKMGGTNYDEGNAITLDNSGNIYIAGYFNTTVDFNPSPTVTNNLSSSGIGDIFVAKYDNNGNYIWAKKMGGAYDDYASSITIDIDGNVITSGAFSSTVDFDPSGAIFSMSSAGNLDAFIQKLSPSGVFIWAKRHGTTTNDEVTTIKIDQDNKIYASGYFYNTVDFDPGAGIFNQTSAGGVDGFLTKLNADGSFIWSKRFGGPSNDEIRGMDLDINKNIYVIGEFKETVNFNAAGSNTLTALAGGIDIFVCKMNSEGIFNWVKRLGGIAYDQGICITVDFDNGDVFAGGSFQGTADFDPGPGIFNLVAGTNNAFVCKLSTNGDFEWVKNLQSTSYSGIFKITIDPFKNIYTTGTFFGNINFDPIASSNTQSSVGSSDYFIQKIRQCALLPNVDIVASDSVACPGQQVILSVNGNNTYSWSGGIINGQAFSPTSTETYTVTATDISGCTNTNTHLITVHPCAINMNVNVFIQALMNGNSSMNSGLLNAGIGTLPNDADTIVVKLASAVPPYQIESSIETILGTNGMAMCTLPYVSGLHYIVINHRNSLETWSSLPVNIVDGMTYNFTVDANQAFGGNQIEIMPGVYALYSGDINQDGIIDNDDFIFWDQSSNNFESGYVLSDLDGSGSVDNSDYVFWESNSNNFVGASKP